MEIEKTKKLDIIFDKIINNIINTDSLDIIERNIEILYKLQQLKNTIIKENNTNFKPTLNKEALENISKIWNNL